MRPEGIAGAGWPFVRIGVWGEILLFRKLETSPRRTLHTRDFFKKANFRHAIFFLGFPPANFQPAHNVEKHGYERPRNIDAPTCLPQRIAECHELTQTIGRGACSPSTLPPRRNRAPCVAFVLVAGRLSRLLWDRRYLGRLSLRRTAGARSRSRTS